MPSLVALSIGYGFALPFILNHYSRTLETVLQTLTGFNLLLLAAAAWAAFRGGEPKTGNPMSLAPG